MPSNAASLNPAKLPHKQNRNKPPVRNAKDFVHQQTASA